VLDDKRAEAQQDFRNVTGRVHAALLVTRLPENELRLEIRDCARLRADMTAHAAVTAQAAARTAHAAARISLPLNCRTRILRK
jgi:hypothetical protein